MSEVNVNDWQFGKHLEQFKVRVLDPQIKRVAEAKAIAEDPDYQWKDDQLKEAGMARYKSYQDALAFYQEFYNQGKTLIMQHERLVNNLAKWYAKWHSDISNEGRQETEMMSMQADILQEIFVEMYQHLKPLNLEGIKQPKALNL